MTGIGCGVPGHCNKFWRAAGRLILKLQQTPAAKHAVAANAIKLRELIAVGFPITQVSSINLLHTRAAVGFVKTLIAGGVKSEAANSCQMLDRKSVV